MWDLFLRSNKKDVIHATADSREVTPNGVFFARKGRGVDGHDFIQDAINSGARYIFFSKKDACDTTGVEGVEFIFNENLEEELPSILNQMYLLPSKIIGITGTNGKTSTCFLAASAFSHVQGVAGLIGTLGAYLFTKGGLSEVSKGSLTTPDIVTCYYLLAKLKNLGCDYVFFEASSIGIIQKRFAGIKLAAACFTNFSQDHLDYHGTMEEYLSAKLLLFSECLDANGFAVMNMAESESFSKISAICSQKNIRYYSFGTPGSDLYTKKIVSSKNGIDFDLNTKDGLKLSLNGEFQIENVLCLLCLVMGFGLNMEAFYDVLASLMAPKGRLERVIINDLNDKTLPTVFIDYAHTPDSLLKAIYSLKKIVHHGGRMIVVFGCGGDRDTKKRPLMGKIASEMADFVIITDDNPRTETPELIRKQIISGIVGSKFKEIGERGGAIHYAICNASNSDVILIAGKGHEDYQIIGKTKLYFDDYKVALKILESASQT